MTTSNLISTIKWMIYSESLMFNAEQHAGGSGSSTFYFIRCRKFSIGGLNFWINSGRYMSPWQAFTYSVISLHGVCEDKHLNECPGQVPMWLITFNPPTQIGSDREMHCVVATLGGKKNAENLSHYDNNVSCFKLPLWKVKDPSRCMAYCSKSNAIRKLL